MGFSLRNLSALCVPAVNLPEKKTAHRRDAENAESAQSFFSRQAPLEGKKPQSVHALLTTLRIYRG